MYIAHMGLFHVLVDGANNAGKDLNEIDAEVGFVYTRLPINLILFSAGHTTHVMLLLTFLKFYLHW